MTTKRQQSQSKKLAQKLIAALEDIKADNIQLLDIRQLSTIADYMIIASGRSNRQVCAMADSVREAAKANGYPVIGTEGYDTGEWVLVDCGDVIVHAMHPLSRAFYQLEKLWGDTPVPAAKSK